MKNKHTTWNSGCKLQVAWPKTVKQQNDGSHYPHIFSVILTFPRMQADNPFGFLSHPYLSPEIKVSSQPWSNIIPIPHRAHAKINTHFYTGHSHLQFRSEKKKCEWPDMFTNCSTPSLASMCDFWGLTGVTLLLKGIKHHLFNLMVKMGRPIITSCGIPVVNPYF